MSFDPKFGPPSQDLDQSLCLTIREFHGHAACPAQDVVTMSLGRPGVMPVTMVHVDVLDQVETRQEFHGSVDAGQADPIRNPEGAPMDLGDLEMFRRFGEHLQYGHARSR
jgi:hypothetical protein